MRVNAPRYPKVYFLPPPCVAHISVLERQKINFWAAHTSLHFALRDGGDVRIQSWGIYAFHYITQYAYHYITRRHCNNTRIITKQQGYRRRARRRRRHHRAAPRRRRRHHHHHQTTTPDHPAAPAARLIQYRTPKKNSTPTTREKTTHYNRAIFRAILGDFRAFWRAVGLAVGRVDKMPLWVL